MKPPALQAPRRPTAADRDKAEVHDVRALLRGDDACLCRHCRWIEALLESEEKAV